MPVFKGSSTVVIGTEENFLKCPSCETTQLAEVFVFSRYYYVYGIPIAPIGKEAVIYCTKCGLERKDVPFEKGSQVFDDKLGQYRHPWYAYIGVGFGVFLLLLPFFARWIHTVSLSKI